MSHSGNRIQLVKRTCQVGLTVAVASAGCNLSSVSPASAEWKPGQLLRSCQDFQQARKSGENKLGMYNEQWRAKLREIGQMEMKKEQHERKYGVGTGAQFDAYIKALRGDELRILTAQQGDPEITLAPRQDVVNAACSRGG